MLTKPIVAIISQQSTWIYMLSLNFHSATYPLDLNDTGEKTAIST